MTKKLILIAAALMVAVCAKAATMSNVIAEITKTGTYGTGAVAQVGYVDSSIAAASAADAAGFELLSEAQTPYGILLGDSRSLINDDNGWISFTRSNLTWGNRLPIIATSISGKTLQSYIDNWDTEIEPLISPVSNLTYLISWVGVNDINTNTAQANLLTLWSNALAAGARVIQFSGGLQQSNAVMNEFIRTNASLYYRFVEITNYSTSDGIHPDTAGKWTIANAYVNALTNYVPDVRRALRGVGQSQLSNGTTNNDTALRLHGALVIDHDPVWNPFPQVQDLKLKFHKAGSDNHIMIMVSNTWANSFYEDLSLLTFGTERMRVTHEGPVEFYAGTRIYALGNARSADSEYLRIAPNAGVYEIKSIQSGAGTFGDVQISGSSTILHIKGFPGSGIGIGTNNPQAALHVVGNGIFSGSLEMGSGSKLFATGSAASTDQEYLRAGALGTDYFEFKSLQVGAGIFRKITFTVPSGSSLSTLTVSTNGTGVGVTNPVTTLHVNGPIALGTNAAGPAGITNGLSAMWNSNGVATYLRCGPVGYTTNKDVLIAVH
jgi:hypothetical protein